MIDLAWSGGRRLGGALLVVLGMTAPAQATERSAPEKAAQLRVVAVTEPEGQILSYRHLAGSTDVHMRGTSLARDARVKLKIGSRPGFVELDINRGGISGLVPASKLGRDFLTYVLWAVSVDGKASNLGEITFDGDRAISVNLTTPYQTFWLMITAEPNYAVVDPSPFVVLYSVRQGASSENKALPIRGDLFFFTHYSTYESAPGGTLANVPNQLLQARKAVELAAKSAVLTGGHLGAGLKEEEYTREALTQATSFLTRAEDAYRRNPKDQEVVQFARTAAQSAENARALAMGAVGGLLIRQLETEVANLRKELARRQAGRGAAPGPLDTLTAPLESGPHDPSTPAIPATAPAQTEPAPPPPIAPPLVKQPALWFAVAGWALALVLLFRRRSI
jgi:hypothetical protein